MFECECGNYLTDLGTIYSNDEFTCLRCNRKYKVFAVEEIKRIIDWAACQTDLSREDIFHQIREDLL